MTRAREERCRDFGREIGRPDTDRTRDGDAYLFLVKRDEELHEERDDRSETRSARVSFLMLRGTENCTRVRRSCAASFSHQDRDCVTLLDCCPTDHFAKRGRGVYFVRGTRNDKCARGALSRFVSRCVDVYRRLSIVITRRCDVLTVGAIGSPKESSRQCATIGAL